MKKIILLFALFMLSVKFSWAASEPVKFIVVRMDYQSYETKYLYYFTQPCDFVLPDSAETVYHDLYVTIVPAGDFGETSIRSRTTGQLVYKASTIWMGAGEHIFPPSASQTNPGDSSGEAALKFIDFEKYFFEPGDEARADTAWRNAQKIAPLSLFGDREYGMLVYLHYFSVGISDPTTAEWIIIFYSMADEIPPGKWANIGKELPHQYINDVHNHFAFEEKIYAATREGAFETFDGGISWTAIEFSDNYKVNVTTLSATPNPWVDCMCEYMYVGTEEYTMIPEDRLGNVYRSEIDGTEWENTRFPGDAVTAIGINPLNPHTAYAASFNPFYHRWGLYKLESDTSWKKLMPHPDDNRLLRINCLAVSGSDTNLVLAGTDQGLMISRDGGLSWEEHLHLRISAIRFFMDQIFISTNNNPASRSDGIWFSDDQGKSWQVWSWWTHCTDLVLNDRTEQGKPAYFFLGDSGKGVFGTREARQNWQDISAGMEEKQVTCLGQNFMNPPAILAGTTKGLYKYEFVTTGISCPQRKAIHAVESRKLLRNYPNPFNASTKIHYRVEDDFSRVQVIVYNSLGQQVRLLVDEVFSKGEFTVRWDGKDDRDRSMPSGIYFAKILLNHSRSDLIKMMLLR